MTDETRQSPTQAVSHDAQDGHRKECDRFMKDGSIRRAFVTIIEPGKIPDGKGPFLTLDQLERFLREALEHHADPATHVIVHQLTWDNQLWTQCARERAAIDAALDEVDFDQLVEDADEADETRQSPTQAVSHARPLRVQRQRTKGWKMPENTVSVTRPGRWGNPYFPGCGLGFGNIDIVEGCARPWRLETPADAVRHYREHMRLMKRDEPKRFEEMIAPLRGKNLACWCPIDQPCHADVLLELANPEQLTTCHRPAAPGEATRSREGER